MQDRRARARHAAWLPQAREVTWPVSVEMLNKEISYLGGTVALPLQITNHDNVQQCFYYGDRVTVPDGWSYAWAIPPGDDGSEQFFGVCIPAGTSINRELLVMPGQDFTSSLAMKHNSPMLPRTRMSDQEMWLAQIISGRCLAISPCR